MEGNDCPILEPMLLTLDGKESKMADPTNHVFERNLLERVTISKFFFIIFLFIY